MRYLYLIRHGQTDYNLRNIVQGGGIDSDLNATGRAQGRRFFEHYRDTDFDSVFCTGLKRTYQTVQDFESLGHDIRRIPDLNEMNWGTIEGQQGSEELRMQFQEINARWAAGELDLPIAGGESPSMVWRRCKRGLNTVLETLPEEGRALVCIHGRVMRIVLAEMLGYGMQKMNMFGHHNTGLNLLKVNIEGRAIAEKLNDLTHLN